MGFFGKKKSRPSHDRYDVTSDSSMTRWPQRHCDYCGNTTMHKVARTHQGSSRAVSTCTDCKAWEEVPW